MVGMTLQERQEMAAIRSIAERASYELATHAAVCSERQGEVKRQLTLIIKIMIGIAGATIGTLVATVGNYIIHFPPHP